jgi:hypothetical protein
MVKRDPKYLALQFVLAFKLYTSWWPMVSDSLYTTLLGLMGIHADQGEAYGYYMERPGDWVGTPNL